jgi:hypothetical protein
MQLFLKKTNGVPPAAPPAAPPAVADQQYILIDYSINNPEFEFHNGMYELLQDLQGRDLKHTDVYPIGDKLKFKSQTTIILDDQGEG